MRPALARLQCVQTFFGWREYFSINFFDVDPSLPGDNLSEELELYPSFKQKLQQMNLASYVLSGALLVVVATNFVVSCILVLRFYSAGRRRATAAGRNGQPRSGCVPHVWRIATCR